MRGPVMDTLSVFMTNKSRDLIVGDSRVPIVDIARIAFLNQSSVKSPELVSIRIMALVSLHAMSTNAVIHQAISIS